jgi:RHS repeat-associated protein
MALRAAPLSFKDHFSVSFALRGINSMRRSSAKVILGAASVFFALLLVARPTGAQSWNNGYAYRRAITISHTMVPNTDQANFAMLFSGTYSYLATIPNGGNVTNSNGYDVIFTSDSAGTNPLAYERQSYNPATGTVNFWVKIPSLSHTTDTVIYLFYCNSSITSDQSNKTAAWDSSYVGVWHMDDKAANTTVSDSTSHGSNGTSAANTTGKSVTGKIGSALSFNGSTDEVTTPLRRTSAFTWEAWFNQSVTASAASIITIDGSNYALMDLAGSTGSFWTADGLGGNTLSVTGISTGTWYHLVFVRSGDNSSTGYSAYLNGVLKGQASSGSLSSGNTITFGFRPDYFQPYTGNLDEIRVSTTARSSDWIATEYNNQSSPSTFYSIASADINGLNGSSSPYIVTLWPTNGPITTPVTVLGANFGSSGTVTFAGVTGTATQWSASSILVPVPTAASTGNVVVTSSSVPSNAVNFTVTNAPGITSISPASGIVGSQVNISGVNFGSPQGSSTVTLNGTSCTVNAWANNSITVTIPSGAVSGPFTVTVGTQSGTSSTFQVAPLPSGWGDGDLGTVGLAGSGVYSGGVFTLRGTGSGLSGGSDNIQFVYEPLSGDGTIIARMVSSSGGQTGVMIRESLNANSTEASTIYQSPNIYNYYRATTGANMTSSGSVSESLPYWLKISRSGNTFSSFASPDGVNWTQVGTTQTITMAQNVYIGLVTSSQNNSSLNTVAFDSVSITSSAAPAPAITAAFPIAGVAGTQVTISGTGFGASQSSSVVLLNSSSITVNSWQSTQITVTVPSGAVAGPMIVCVAPTMNCSNAVTFYVGTQVLASWLDLDIGNVGLAGSATYSNGTFTVKGSGNGVAGSSDAMNFVFLPMSGDGTIVARVVSLSGGEAGLMIRETPNASATNAYVADNTNLYYYYRPSTGSSTSNQGSTGFSGLPYWLKLVRAGNVITAYSSPTGLYWTQLNPSETIPMTQNIYFGLAVSSESNSSLASATFDNVSVSSGFAAAPVITSVSGTTGTVGTQIQILGNGFGSSQGSSYVSLNGLPVTVNFWGATVIDITIPSGATSGNLVVTVAPTMNNSNPVEFDVTSQPLPQGWLDEDIGPTGGGSSYANQVFTVMGTGSSIGGTADGFHFVYQPLSGDGSIVARVVHLQGVNFPQAGVMIRETLDPSSKEVFAYFQPNQGQLYYRSSTGGSTSTQQTSLTASAYPYWVKLTRSGNTFTGYISVDGIYWTQMGSSQSVTMAQNVYIGMAVSPTGETVTFDNVSLNSSASPAPIITSLSASTVPIGGTLTITGSNFGSIQGQSVVTLNNTSVSVTSWSDGSITVTIPTGSVSGPLLVSVAPSMNDSNAVYLEVTSLPIPTGWMDQDVGSVGVGSATYSSGVFTVKGAGGWVSGSADALHFVYQPITGDGSIIARVASLQGVSSPQVGLMVRETLDPSSTNVFAFFQPNQGYLYYRTTTSANISTQATSFVASAYPYWLKLTRSGSTFTGYISLDGISWTQLGSSQSVNMAQNVYIGMAVSSSGETASFDNVSLSISSLPAPTITNLSATTGAVGSQITITGSGFGSSQGNGAVFLSDAPMNVNSWNNTSITITLTSNAISGYLVVAAAPDLNSSNPEVFTVTGNPLPSGWLDSDIGTVGMTGSATFSTGTFTIAAAGQGLSGAADGFHFAYQTLSGDGVITARVSNIQGAGYSSEVGVMIRESSSPGATNAAVYFYPNTAGLTVRTTTGGTATTQTTSFVGPAYPYWVKLARVGSSFLAYVSEDGTNWTQVGTAQTISMAQSVEYGLAASSQSTSRLLTAAFDHVSILSGTMPTISSVSPNSGTIGTTVTVSGANFGSSQGSSTLYFNGVPATSIGTWGNNQIIANVPSNASTGPITVVVNSIPSNTDQAFSFYHPVLASLSPSTAQHGATIVLNGSGFGGVQNAGSNVFFNSVAGDVLSWSDTSITVGIPSAGTSGPVTVVVGGITSNSQQFTLENLSITGMSTSVAVAGTVVTISRTGFGDQQNSSTVDFHGTSAAVQSWSDTQIQAVVPQFATSGSVNVGVGGIMWYGPHFLVAQTAQLTDSKSNETTYTSLMVGGIWRPLSVQGSGCSTCSGRGNINYIYDGLGRVLSRTDENGNTTSYTYDSNNNVLTVTVPITSSHTATTTYTYNSFGEVLTTTDPLGNVTTNIYDANGNLLTVTTPAPGNGASASVTRFAYDPKGELTQIADPLGNQTNIAYFPTGMIQTITDAQSNVTTYAYDSRGNRTSATDANNKQTTFTYDLMNRLTKITYPDSTTTQFGYDVRGRRTSVTDQNGKQTTYAYDDADRLTTVTDAAGNGTTYGYDSESNLTSIKDANSNTTTFDYDAFGRVTETHFPSGYVEQYSYDNVGNLISKTDRKNQQITYTYDQLNRLTQKTYPDTTTVNYTYDDDSRLTQVTDPTGTYAFTFDNMGRLTNTSTQYSFLTSRTFTTSYGYDAASNRTSFTDPESGATNYLFDTLNRLQTLTPPTAISSGSFGFGYDALSRRTSLTRPNSVNSSYTYDNLSHPLSVTHAKGGVTLDGASYGLDNAGNRTSKNDLYAGVTTNYSYDNIYELLGATQGSTTTESYTYDPVGNRLSNLSGSGWSNNTSNELTSRPGTTYTYDANGNTHTIVNSSGTMTYAWDFENRLTSVTLPGSGGTISYKYDPMGRRIYKSSSSGTSIYAYDGVNLIEETNSSGVAIARYEQTDNIDEPVAMLRGGTTTYYETDGLGSVTSLSGSTGTLGQSYTFDSFGNQTASSGSLTNPFRYAGREFDLETNLYFYRARYFDPAAGRFLSEDPLEFAGGRNFYAYTRNRPIDLVDPSGMAPTNSSNGAPPLMPGDTAGFFHADLNDPRLKPLLNRDTNGNFPAGTRHYGESDWCVGLTKLFTGLPCSGCWRAGSKVLGNNIPAGTAIATFDDQGLYHNESGWNSGIYVGPSGPLFPPNTITIIDQWPGHNASARDVLPTGTRPNRSGAYSVITVPFGTTAKCGKCGNW